MSGDKSQQVEALNRLAVEAKHSDDAFCSLLDELRPSLNYYVASYARQWNVEKDEVEQWAFIETWNAVRAYDPNGMSFFTFWKWVVTNHIKTRLRRLKYGKRKEPDLKAARFDFSDGCDSEHETWSRYQVRIALPETESAEDTFLKEHLFQTLHKQLADAMSSLSELEIWCTKLFYFEGYSYLETQQALQLHSRKPVDNALARVKKKLGKNQALSQLYTELKAL
ncbi:hypothetical protein GCM10025857_20530 [Alicyclobacillus contaminans]|uniref:sigma-70 family RNA polymerase sigma factor n=1 Tax=Alicyclobacillus contaminans TaxID=392016 RepID=UPI000404D6D1|nr:sigma-70 family RNA polymerase sigma factor [Alicyclobacillus contaminans]GMA50696.1 hypothetical protein GCM10025857_20530 [Alicyclobacillus contaminans]